MNFDFEISRVDRIIIVCASDMIFLTECRSDSDCVNDRELCGHGICECPSRHKLLPGICIKRKSYVLFCSMKYDFRFCKRNRTMLKPIRVTCSPTLSVH